LGKIILACFITLLGSFNFAYGWNCKGHVTIARVAASDSSVPSILTGDEVCAPDRKSSRQYTFTHYVNNDETHIIVSNDFSVTQPELGQLYERIYSLSKEAYDGSELTLDEKIDLIHALGDMSNPMHHIIYQGFNKDNHSRYDNYYLDPACMTTISDIADHESFIAAAVKLANQAKLIGYRDKNANAMMMTKNEACNLTSQSVNLIKAVEKRMH
jgi:hypothetical protein